MTSSTATATTDPILMGTAIVNAPPYVKDLILKLEEKKKRGEGLVFINGAFGDMEKCDGIVESVIQPSEGGVFTKMYGCEFLFKGYPVREVVNMLGLPKSMLSIVPKETIGRSRFLQIGLVLFFLFSRRQFYHTFRAIFHRIHDLSLMKVRYTDLKRFCRPVRHLRWCFEETMRREYDLDINSKMVLFEEVAYIGKREKYILLAFMVEICYFLIEYDNAYRLRFQDIIGEFNRDAFEKNPRKELLRLCDILIQREKANGMKEKWAWGRRVISVGMLFPKIKKFITTFMLMIQLEEVKADEHDRYFSLRRSGYDFFGLPVEERLEMKAKIDKEKGHIAMQIVNVKQPDGRIVAGIQIL